MRDKKEIISDFLKLSPEDKITVVNGLSAVKWHLGGDKYGSIGDMVSGASSAAVSEPTDEEMEAVFKTMGIK